MRIRRRGAFWTSCARSSPSEAALLASAALLLAIAGCQGPPQAQMARPPGTTHAPPRAAEGADPDERRRALAEAEAPAAIVGAADRLERAGGALRAERRRVLRAVDALPAGELASRWGALEGDGAAAAALALRAARWALHRGDDAEALAWLLRVGGDPELEARGAELKAEILELREVDPRRIALLLPLSGRHASVGEEIRRGAELAAARQGDAELVFLDTEGEAAGAVAAVDEAVRRHRAAAILGPVGRREASSAARRAVALGVPIAVLSPAVAGGASEARVFRLWSSPAAEGAQAARLAARLRYERVGILAPRDEGGAARARAFAETAARLGVEVTARGRYDPTASNLEPDLREFLGLDPAQNERLRRHLRRHGRGGWKTFVPELDFELLYIPDRYDRAALAVSFLPYFNVEVRTDPFMNVEALRERYGVIPPVVQLVGSAGWRHPSLVPRGGRAVRGALIVGVCRDAMDLDADGMAFAAEFAERYGREPGDVASQAYDATTLLLTARRYAELQRRGDVRAEIGRALSRLPLDDAACGPGRVRGGELVREPAIFEVRDEDLTPYED